ncbi:hypothetical protein GBAR_LOCUS15708 [Geodia barretti]|uniref:Uncharacterized protein n=1 Tax=Geodia barretti TaxID=519541 RepID=A0AA35SCI0_GEOBA|nr:hypothetical protein GBAR_LOCUS15708 [Geodia barretti]
MSRRPEDRLHDLERREEMASEEGEMSTISAHDLAREIHSNQVQYSTTISTLFWLGRVS